MELPPQRIDQLWRDLCARQAWDQPYAILYFECLEIMRGDVPAPTVLCRILTLLSRNRGAENSVRLYPSDEDATFDFYHRDRGGRR
jgi:hypothetical protein